MLQGIASVCKYFRKTHKLKLFPPGFGREVGSEIDDIFQNSLEDII